MMDFKKITLETVGAVERERERERESYSLRNFGKNNKIELRNVKINKIGKNTISYGFFDTG